MKMYTQWLKIGVVAAAALGLAACHTGYKPLPAGQTAEMGAEQADGASAYGMKTGDGYQGQGQKDANGRLINALVAPSNQTYYFEFDSDVVAQEDMKAISIQANYLATHPSARIRLEGNTDNRGSREYNIGLGWRRDQAVARIFEQQGVNAKQIVMVSYGKERPAAMGNNEAAWQLNRRVSLVYEAK